MSDHQVQIDRAREVAHVLYEGVQVAHRSCGVALAETFGRPTGAYLLLRRGGLTGEGVCGAIRAGEMVVGELLCDPDPAVPVSDTVRAAVADYRRLCDERLDRGPDKLVTCSDLLARVAAPFESPERKGYCTSLSAEVAAIVAEVVLRHGGTLPEMRVPER